ncbi:conserved hypothetical protein [Thermosulfidibacter takaii ABI70S6]|uniref:TIGR01777 family protein n=1 Tax=Thermosulfidibacter takaii (strain DSM 17441 / JCM 13301 / NBRC 103674 / ABI70S6) TaxID=1298851 RepID=A0A0S3QUK8_THET7|nr:TIGR01777 family oxidoreductase [Thermosulfidibacter takaii]BAT72002.1 conserved hypothetical protein [Thermosulfidibacter takaii ABI70S6]
MKIAITGGTGLIGKAFIQELFTRNCEVVVFTRFPERWKNRFPSNIRLVRWINEAERIAPHLEGVYAIVNLAGENIFRNIWTKRGRIRIYESRITVGRILSSACKLVSCRPTLLLQMSAVGYYGDRGRDLIDEAEPPGTGFLSRVCVDWEDSTKEVESLGIRRVVMRTGIVLSREGGFLKLQSLLTRVGLSAVLGSGKNYMPWIHIRDLVRAFVFFIENGGTEGVYNLVSPNPVTAEVFMKELAKVLKRPLFLRVPSFLLRVFPEEVRDFLLASLRVIPKRLTIDGFSFLYPELKPALVDLLAE